MAITQGLNGILNFGLTNPPPKRSAKQKLRDQIEYLREENKNEIDRGNDLCRIIHKLINYEALEMHEMQRVVGIVNNVNLEIRTKAREKWASKSEG